MEQVIASMDGTGVSPATVDAMKNKFHSCFLGSDEGETSGSEAPSESEIAEVLPLSEDLPSWARVTPKTIYQRMSET